MALLGAIRGATTGAPWEVLLDMVGTENFGATYPRDCCIPLPEMLVRSTEQL